MNSIFFVLTFTFLLLGPANCQKGKKANCLLPTSSPQFAELCKLGTGLEKIIPGLKGYTADQVCDFDCRCTHGAQRGGKCGKINGKEFCRCDWNSPATKGNVITDGSVCEAYTKIVGSLICNVVTPVANFACNVDCQCSHGHKPSKRNNICTTKNGVKGNAMSYCVCNKAKNV